MGSLRTTFRLLNRAKALSVAVVLMLAVGAGVLTATFGVVNAALLRLPPFPHSDRIALLYLERNPQGERPSRERWSFPRFELLRRSQRSFEEVASYSPGSVTISGNADAEVIQIERVSASYFAVLGASAVNGRVFSEADDDPARPSPVVVISDTLWKHRWPAEASLLGRTVRLNGVPLTVVGVMPPGFGGVSGTAQLWVPRTLSPQITYAEYLTTNQNFISAIGRLRAGTSLADANTELAVLGAQINRALPSDPEFPQERVTATAVTLNDARSGPAMRRPLFILLAAVALLHLLASANAINLLLGRMARKRQDWGIRAALGCSSARLFRHIYGEGLLLAGMGGALGLALAACICNLIAPPANVWAARNFYGSVAPFDAPAFGSAELAFGMAVALATALFVPLLPALSAFRLDIGSTLKAAGRGISPGGITLRRPSARGLIVGIEMTAAMVLVLVSGLLIDSFQRMRHTSIGVEQKNVLTFWIIPSEARVPPSTAPAFVSRLLDALARLPGVRSVSVDGGAPLAGTANSVLYIQGRAMPPTGQAPPVLRHYVAPDHFLTLGIPLLRGRAFTTSDVAGAPRVAVISETAARRFWPGEDPLGKRVWFGGGSDFDSPANSAEIVGIIGDVIYAPLDKNPNLASFYTPYAQFTYASRCFFLRTAVEPMSIVPAVRKAIASVDPELAMRDVQPLEDVVSGSWARHRFDAFLFGGFGVIAMLLAASGIFAVLSNAVAERTREFGIRIALGAVQGRVLRQVLLEGLAFPLAGVALGGAAALAASGLLRSSLYGISPREPRVFALTAVLLLSVAAAACLAPAWRATRSDPMEALRAE